VAFVDGLALALDGPGKNERTTLEADRAFVALRGLDRGRKVEPHLIPAAPLPVDLRHRPPLGPRLRPPVHLDRGLAGPGGNAQVQGEVRGPVDLNGQVDFVAERIIGLFLDGHFRAVTHLCGHLAGTVAQGSKAGVRRGAPHRPDELGPPLVHVGRAARVAIEKPEAVFRAAVVGRKRRGRPRHVGRLDLVDLLVILTPHVVVGVLGRKRVVGHPLQPVGEVDAPGDAGEHFKGIHELDYATELGAVHRVGAVQELVPREHALRLAVVAPQILKPSVDGLEVPLLAGQQVLKGRLFQAHRRVDHVPVALLRLEAAGPVEGLLEEGLGQVQEVRPAGAVVEPVDTGLVLPAPHLRPPRPVIEGLLRQHLPLVPEIVRHELRHPLVAGGTVVDL